VKIAGGRPQISHNCQDFPAAILTIFQQKAKAARIEQAPKTELPQQQKQPSADLIAPLPDEPEGEGEDAPMVEEENEDAPMAEEKNEDVPMAVDEEFDASPTTTSLALTDFCWFPDISKDQSHGRSEVTKGAVVTRKKRKGLFGAPACGGTKRCAQSKWCPDAAEQSPTEGNANPVKKGPGYIYEFTVCHCPVN